MSRSLVLVLCLAQTFPLFGQLCPPQILTQQEQSELTFGSFSTYRRTTDGGYFLGGQAYYPVWPDRTSPSYGMSDSILVRLDSNLGKMWDQSYGGTNNEYVSVALQTSDGGFILGGESSSGASGNKTSTNYGRSDFWIVRTDSDGNLLWEQSYGGTNFDGVFDVQQTADGGFILGGYSYSGPSGNKTSPFYGGVDYWVVRTDAAGNKLWDRSFGGSGYDRFSSIVPTPDGGCLVAGFSDSLPGGTKIDVNYGSVDYWIVRLNPNGDELWQRVYGGSGYDQLIKAGMGADGGFVLVGTSDSPPSGTKSSPRRGYQDYWVVTLDANGNGLWEQSAGGSTSAGPQNVSPMSDGGWVVGGTVYPGLGGNKTSPNFGEADYWLVRFDASGNILWDQTYGGKAEDYLYNMESTPGGELILIGQSSSRPGGNKTTPRLSPHDLWVLKLGLETPGDCDGDGIPDGHDLCPGTGLGAIVNTNGCSIAQLCPCNGPWTNNSEYVACVTQVAGDFFQAGLITQQQRDDAIGQASEADCPHIPQPILAFGLTNFPIRDATIEYPSETGGLFVYDLAFDGGDGVSMQLGQADSGVFIYPDAPVTYNYDSQWFMLATAYGSRNGVTNSPLSTMRATKPDYEVYPVAVDFSALGADSLTYQVFSGNTLIVEATEPGPTGGITVHSASYTGPRGNPFWRAADGSIGARIDLDTTESPSRFNITGPFYAAQGDHIFIRANNPTNTVEFVSRVDVVEGGGLPNFSVLDARLGMFHHAHQALGLGVFSANAGKLKIAPRGGILDENDIAGTVIELNRSNRVEVQLEPVRLTTNGAAFEVYATGIIDEVPNFFGSFGMTNLEGTLHVKAEFFPFYGSTNVEPQSVQLKVYKNGSLDGSLTNPAGTFSFTASAATPGIVNCGIVAVASNAPYAAFTLDKEADFTDGSGAVLHGNHFQLVPVEPAQHSESVLLLSLAVRKFESFTIIGEQEDGEPPALSIVITADNVVLSWPNQNRPFILESAPSLDDDFSPVAANAVFANNKNTVTLPLETKGFFQLRLSND